MSPEENVHASFVAIEDRGLLIAGRSGSGKTTLALELLARQQAAGRFARLVADDRVLLSKRGGRLVGRSPEPISGLAEAHGVGPRRVGFEPAAIVDLIVELAPADKALRFSDGERRVLVGCELPLLVLAERNVLAAVLAIAASLGLRPFGNSLS